MFINLCSTRGRLPSVRPSFVRLVMVVGERMKLCNGFANGADLLFNSDATELLVGY